MKEIDAVFDPASTWKPIEEGTYPAHIKSLTTKEVMTKKAGPAIVVNMTYVVQTKRLIMTNLYLRWMVSTTKGIMITIVYL